MDIIQVKKKDPLFPSRLKDIRDVPDDIYYLGSLPAEDIRSVAIIGARECSQYGRMMAEQLSLGLAREGIQIISGMAIGIDGISQMSALKAGGRSFAVLGSGVDVCYPKCNRGLYDLLLKNGGVISEYMPGTRPASYNFPRRNRLISALCDVLIVIEARLRSGTFITVDFALEQGKEIMALPGRVTDPLSVGCNALIGQGAHPVQCVQDVMDILETVHVEKRDKPKRILKKIKGPSVQGKPDVIPALTGDEAAVYKCLDLYPVSSEEMAEQIQLPIYELSEMLISLESKGLIREVSKGNYIRLD